MRCHYSAGTGVGRGSFETTGNRVLDIMSHTWDEWSYLSLLLFWVIIRPEDGGAAFEQKNKSHLGMPGGKSPGHAPKPLLGE